MARIKSKRSALQTLSCKFGGMARRTPGASMRAEDMCNFRILPDGTLKVRSGYTLKKQFPTGKKIRGFWEGTLGEDFLTFAVAGEKVYLLSGEEMDETAVGTIADGEDNVHFCVYEDVLYLLDGNGIWTYRAGRNKFEAAEPYVPLYGYSWTPANYGSVYEEINLLTPRLRMNYYNPDGATVFTLPFYAASIDIIRSGSRKITDYTFSAGSNQVTIPGAPAVVEIGFTTSLNADLRATMLAAQMSFIYSNGADKKMFLWDNQGRLFCSREANQIMLSSCHTLYPNATQPYFCAEDILFLGDNEHPIKTICPFYETLLVFTSDRIWSLAFEKGEIKTTLATHEIGCSSPYGVMVDRDSVLAAMDDGLYRISASPARQDDLFLERLSVDIDEKFPDGFTEKVILMRNFAGNEIWMRDPSNTDGEVWIWNTDAKDWYRYNAINASLFFKRKENIGFAQGNSLLLFHRSCSTDNGAPISARYKSTYLDFDAADSPYRSMRAFLYSSPGNNYQVWFETEREERSYMLSASSSAKTPKFDDMRIGTHRYRFLRFTLSMSANKPTEFYRLDIYSKP